MRARIRRFIERHAPRLVQELEGIQYRMTDRYTVRDGAAPVLPERFRELGGIPGMLPYAHCIRLYFLAYGSASLGGDIIEIGSWQGRSTAFLAQACADTDAGVVHAIDHFRGNPGAERHYVMGAADLSDLERNFRANMEAVGLSDRVRLHAADAGDVAADVAAAAPDARLLFVDGEHTAAGVRRDLALYAPLLKPGGLIVFDDYAPRFEGYVRELRDAVIASEAFGSVVSYERTLVARKL